MTKYRGEKAHQFLKASCSQITEDSTGWEVLFREVDSVKLWIKMYPDSEMHGGGEMLVVEISEQAAKEKFGEF